MGGLVGMGLGDDSVLSNVYATGDVWAMDGNVGGLVGVWELSEMEFGYASGEVGGGPGPELRGGVGGVVSGHYVADHMYWDLETAGDWNDGFGDASAPNDATGLETDEFADEESFHEDWDFDDVWTIDEAPDGEDRPIFQWQQ